MATVELRFSALPGHVRTARLVAAAVARRVGVDESVLDEVRLAVGEACSRAVGLHQRSGVEGTIRVALTDLEKRFLIEVEDEAGPILTAERDAGAEPEAGEDDLGLAVITGLVEDVEVDNGAEGGLVKMSWPIANVPVEA
ncbi:ATP-binding protein [Kitasatospora sp. NPDC048540]|uniref:ATP-binding protein n=1 Tax=unclassified Kitasatospora TaxID=2633591 RepID=UPI00053A7FC7|nr:ATP-binding protein [Kitasatospora sp. MBT63]